MQRINAQYFYLLAKSILPLRSLEPGKTVLDSFAVLWEAEKELNYFLYNPIMPPTTSFADGKALYDGIQHFTGKQDLWTYTFEFADTNELKDRLDRFEVVLQAEFARRDTFIVSPKGAYSTTILAETGQTVVTTTAHELVPSMKDDLHDGCRCLAFELPTAAAFHFFRALEAMVKDYGEFVRSASFTEREKKGGLGAYANLLKQTDLKVDRRIINSIEQIASLHRNPTMHPQMHISNTEIMATLGMVVSVIETIAIDWNRRKTTPEIPLSDILPDDSKVTALLEEATEGTLSNIKNKTKGLAFGNPNNSQQPSDWEELSCYFFQLTIMVTGLQEQRAKLNHS